MPTVNPVTDPQGALSQMATDPMMRQMLERQQQGYEQQQEQLGRVRTASERVPESYETERMGAMALMAGKSPQHAGGFGQLLANIGGAYSTTLAQQAQRDFDRESKVLDAVDKSAMPFGSGAATALLQAQLNPFVNVGGVGLVNRRSGQLAVPSNMLPEYNKLYTALYKQATEQKMENPEQWAQEQAMAQLGAAMGSRAVAGSRATPLPPAPGQAPAVEVAPIKEEGGVDLTPGTDVSRLIKQVERDEKMAVSKGDYAMAAELQKAKQALRAKAGPEGLQYRDIPKSKMEEATAEVTGKALGTTFEDMQTASAASSDLKIQLNALRELFKTPNLPEGQLGEQLQGIRSGLKSLGIDVGKDVAAGDMVNAIGGKLALLTRTADGKNLMPGAMSDFEQKILRGLAPGLNQTAEGRDALVGFLSNMADIRIRLASEASKLAAENRGILPPDWYQRRDRLLKEEQARMAVQARDISKRLQGAK
jgi:hypothetical protein